MTAMTQEKPRAEHAPCRVMSAANIPLSARAITLTRHPTLLDSLLRAGCFLPDLVPPIRPRALYEVEGLVDASSVHHRANTAARRREGPV
jgi:hypothetical protein